MSTALTSQPHVAGLNIVIYQTVLPRLRELLSQGILAGVFAYFINLVFYSFFISNYYKIFLVAALPLCFALGVVVGLLDGFAVWCCRRFFDPRLGFITRLTLAGVAVGLACGALAFLYPPGELTVEDFELMGVWSLVPIISLCLVTGSRLRPWRAIGYGLRRVNSHQGFPTTVARFFLGIALLFGCFESILLFTCIVGMNESYLTLFLLLLVVIYFLTGLVVVLANPKFWLTATIAVVINAPWLFILVKFFSQPNLTWFLILGYLVLWCGFLLTRLASSNPLVSSVRQELRYYYLID